MYIVYFCWGQRVAEIRDNVRDQMQTGLPVLPLDRVHFAHSIGDVYVAEERCSNPASAVRRGERTLSCHDPRLGELSDGKLAALAPWMMSRASATHLPLPISAVEVGAGVGVGGGGPPSASSAVGRTRAASASISYADPVPAKKTAP